MSANGKGFHDIAQRLMQVEGFASQLQLASLDLGEVQDIVQQDQQRIAGLMDDVQVLALFVLEFGAQHQFRHSDNGVHRCADFMTHVRQKSALGNTGLLALVARGLQGLAHRALADLEDQCQRESTQNDPTDGGPVEPSLVARVDVVGKGDSVAGKAEEYGTG